MTTMRAIMIPNGSTDAASLFLGEMAKPVCEAHEILIEVKAAGVNRPDIAQREGNYPPPPGASPIMGLEVAGTVAAIGDDVDTLKIGDRVCALLPGGGYAEFATVDARHALPIPAALGFEEAAGLPETVFTVWTNLFEDGGLKAGETVLIHGANSGIGSTAIAMAKAAGAKVIATARGAEKAALAERQGADIAIDHTEQDFVAIVQDQGGADVVLDILGGPYFERNLAALKTDGRLVQIAFLCGQKVELDLMTLLFKRLHITASTLRARDPAEKARLASAIRENVWPWIEGGEMKVSIDRSFPFAQAGEAQAFLEAGNQFGKVVLTMS